MDVRHFLKIKRKYGDCASWAIWANAGETAKSNTGDLSIFDHRRNPQLLDSLNPNIVIVGLNIARPFEGAFANFHDDKAMSQDYKIRYALSGTLFTGAYMTDIIKYLDCTDSNETMRRLREDPRIEKKNVERFRQELVDIRAENPLIVALGGYSFQILNRNFKRNFKIVRLRHYSDYVNVEVYRAEVQNVLDRL